MQTDRRRPSPSLSLLNLALVFSSACAFPQASYISCLLAIQPRAVRPIRISEQAFQKKELDRLTRFGPVWHDFAPTIGGRHGQDHSYVRQGREGAGRAVF